MFFGSDWLANLYMGCFLFGLIFTSLSLVLNFVHIGGGHTHVADAGGHALGHAGGHDLGHLAHGPHAPIHTAGGHSSGTGPLSGAEQVQMLGPLNIPTILAFITWFGGAGYIFRTTLGWPAIVTAVLAVVSGLAGGALIFAVLTYFFQHGQTPPMRRADYYLPGTRARVISTIAEGGTGEIVFMKGGSRRVEGARSETGSAIPRGVEVTIQRYDKGLAYVQPVITVTDLPPPERARVEDAPEPNTQPLVGSGPSVTRDLRNRT